MTVNSAGNSANPLRSGFGIGENSHHITGVSNRSNRRTAPAYTLTPQLLSEYGGEILCIDERAIGKHHRLHRTRPDVSTNVIITRNDVVTPEGVVDTTEDLVSDTTNSPTITRVDVNGPIEQRAGYHDPCGGWTDGHDAISERLSAALESGDVLLVMDSPGGAHAGLQEAIRQVLKEKELHGRRITGYVNEMCGSAMFWWAACVCDEIYGPEACLVGSIGARGGHQSVAGALEQQGIATTYFAWPGAGKVAFAPELPLSDLGKQRGNRDVADAGEAFAKAVGPRRGLTRDEIVDLNADVLSGHRAVAAKLIDGVASLDEVMAYALEMASRSNDMQVRTEDPKRDPESPEEAKARAEGDGEEPQKPGRHPEPDGDEPRDEDDDEPEEPPSKEEKKAFCAYCGNKLPGMESESEEPDGDEGDDEPAKEDRMSARAAVSNAQISAAIAPLFGLSAGASVPAVKTAALAYARLGKAVMTATATVDPQTALGAFRALHDDAKESAKVKSENKQLRAASNHREKMDLLHRLAAADLPGYSRGELFVDREVNGKVVVEPAPEFAEMKLATLRGLVDRKTAGHTVAQRNPYEPDREKAREAKTEASAEKFIETPLVAAASQRSTADREQLARTAAALEAAGMFK